MAQIENKTINWITCLYSQIPETSVTNPLTLQRVVRLLVVTPVVVTPTTRHIIESHPLLPDYTPR